jgi:two-component system, chemotaxis family, protein-glutamate methylesterase/glutaminase
VEVIAKPESNRDLTLSKDFQSELISQLEGLVQAKPRAMQNRSLRSQTEQSAVPANAQNMTRQHAQTGLARDLSSLVQTKPRTLLIGASTGGPRAISRVLFDLKSVLPNISTLVVRHPLLTRSAR